MSSEGPMIARYLNDFDWPRDWENHAKRRRVVVGALEEVEGGDKKPGDHMQEDTGWMEVHRRRQQGKGKRG